MSYFHIKPDKSRVFFFLAAVLLLKCSSLACTNAIFHSSITSDGRPIFLKMRSPGDQYEIQQLRHFDLWFNTYDYISVNGSMGLNEMGLATGNTAASACGTPGVFSFGDYDEHTSEGTGGIGILSLVDPNELVENGDLLWYILSDCGTLDDVRDFLNLIYVNQTCWCLGTFPILDATGDMTMFEINRYYWLREYHPLDPDRIAQGTYGFVIRGNWWHCRDDGADNLTFVEDTTLTGTLNVQSMMMQGDGKIDINEILRGNSDPNTGAEFIRYGPYRELFLIASNTNRASVIVHGVAPGEDPALSTMWVISGQANYGIAVPAWVKVSDIPDPLGNGWQQDQHLYQRAQSLFFKGDELTIQNSTYKMESHIFSEVIEGLLPHWREFGTPTEALMTRVEHQIAYDAYSLLNCLDLVDPANQAPEVSFEIEPNDMTLALTLNASDADGTITSVSWNFGDGGTSSDLNPVHTYAAPGDYLISCTVTDDDGVDNTNWEYFRVPADFDIACDDDVVNECDLAGIAEHWLSSCGEPDWCGGADFNHSGKVDAMDTALMGVKWLND